MGGANQTVSAGIGGFVAFFLLALALWFLTRSMNTHLRNLSYREERAEREEEQRLAAADGGPEGDQPFHETRPSYLGVDPAAAGNGVTAPAGTLDPAAPASSTGEPAAGGLRNDESGRSDVGGKS